MSADETARMAADAAARRIIEHEERCERRYNALENGLKRLEERHYELIKTVAFSAVGVVVSIIISALIISQ